MTLIAVGIFVFQILSAQIGFLSLAFNQLFSGVYAGIVVGVIFFAIGIIPVVGAILIALITLIDLVVLLICTIIDTNEADEGTDINDTFAQEYVCGGLAGALTKLVEYLVYDQTPMVDLANPERLNITNIDINITDDVRGMAVGSTLDVALDVDTALYAVDPNSAENFSLAFFVYSYQFSDKHVKDSVIDYELTTNPRPLDEAMTLGDMASTWVAPSLPLTPTVAGWAADSNYVARIAGRQTTLTLDRAGINQPLTGLVLSEGTLIHVQECWLVPNPIPPFVPPAVPVCYLRDEGNTNYINLGQDFQFDIFPATTTDFMRLTPRENGSYALAWDSKFPALKDADGDGLISPAFGGNDPDDSLPDTDFDGLSDSFEIKNGSSPILADGDNDGLNDYAELRLGTNPFLADTDGDGLTDKEEMDGWDYAYGFDGSTPLVTHVTSDPLSPNIDGDDYTDAQERVYGFNPNVPTSGDILDISAEVAQENLFVTPGKTIPYTVTLANNLKLRYALGLLDADFPAAVKTETLDPQPFIVRPTESVVMAGEVEVDDQITDSQTISLTNIAGARILDALAEVGGRSLWLPMNEAAGATSFADTAFNALSVTCATCPTPGVEGYLRQGLDFLGHPPDRGCHAPDPGHLCQWLYNSGLGEAERHHLQTHPVPGPDLRPLCGL